MQFFKSNNVKIFPCFSRGTYICNSDVSTDEQVATIDNAEDNLSSTRIFDPEARLITEASLTSLYGNVLGHKNYIVEIDVENNITKVVIQGYYFEITDFKLTSGDKLAIKLNSIKFTNPETNLIDPNRITYRLSSLAPEYDVLDYFESSDNTYYCTAIGQITNDEELTDDLSILSFDDNVLRLDAKDDDALAIFTAGHAQTVKDTKDFVDNLGTFQGEEGKSQFDRVKASIESITAESLGLNAFVNKSPTSLKESFKGEVKEDSDGFALGKDVYVAIQQLEDSIGNLDHVMNFRGAYAKFEDVNSPEAGDVITFSEDYADKARAGSEWVYTEDNTWVEIGTASASDAAIANNRSALELQAKDITDIQANKLDKGHLTDHAKSQAELDDDFERVHATIVGSETDTEDTLTIYGARKYAYSLANTLTGTETDLETDLTLYGLQKAITVLKGDEDFEDLGEVPDSLLAEAAARKDKDTQLQGQITNLTDSLNTHLAKTAEHTNTAHSHSQGTGTTVTGSGGIEGNVVIDLNLEFATLDEDRKLKLVDKTSKAVVAEFDATDFIKDGMLHDVSYNAETNELTFIWNTDGDSKTDVVQLSDIIDPYVFEAGAKLDVTVDGTKVTYSHETVAPPAESIDIGTSRKYLTGVTTDGYGHITGFTTASETDQDLTHNHDEYYKVTQTPFTDPIAEGDSMEFIASISQDAQGVIAATKKTVKAYTKEDVYNKEEVYNKKEIDDKLDAISYSLGTSGATLYLTKNINGTPIRANQADLTEAITNVFNSLVDKLRFYEVNFDGNGGSGLMSSRIVAGSNYSLPGCKYDPPCPTHQQFKGWSLSSDDSETIISEYTFADDDTKPTFYAIWETTTDSLEVRTENQKYPTCTKAGSYDKVYYCPVCNEEISRESIEISKTEHNWDDGEETKAPSAVEPGEKTYKCEVCGTCKTEPIPALGSDPESET